MTTHGERIAHVVPFRVLAAVWLALLVFTVLTVAATAVDLGRGNLFLALGIATVKAALVILYFMHMRYDHPFHAVVFIAGLLFVVLFIVLALMDTQAYQPELIPGYAPGMEKP